MIIFKKSKDLLLYLKSKVDQVKIGFVPTMGALHEGHLSLIKASKKNSEITIVSIFVNPTQFNDASDLRNYPRNTEADIELLSKNEIDILYLPEVKDIYQKGTKEDFNIDLGYLDAILEGEFRTGHFKGVAQVVYKLLQNTRPHLLFMGQKDFQQLAVIRKMIDDYDIPVQLITCPIVRESDGLAKSSRNVRLTPQIRDEANKLHKTLQFAKAHIDKYSINELEKMCSERIHSEQFKVEYFEIRGLDLKEVTHAGCIALTAVWAGDVRLIDNMILK